MTDNSHETLDNLLKGQAHGLTQIMQRNILTCQPSMTVAEAANQMVSTRCSSIVVLEAGRPAGIWTEHDALLVDPDDAAALDRPVGEVMSKPVRTIHQDVTIEAATLRFRDEGLRHYIVVDDKDRLVGVVSQSDVVRQHDVRHFLSMRSVGTVIRRSTLILQASSTLAQAAVRLHNHGTDCAVVIFGDGKRGIVTERDLLKAVASRRGGLKVGDISASPIISVPQTVSVLEARESMERRGIRHLGVTDGEGSPVGMLSYADILASVEFSILRYVEEMLSERSRALNQTQNRLRGALDELSRSNDELEEFVQAISVGFKTPLDRMTGCLDMLGGTEVKAVACAKEQARQLKTMLDGVSYYAEITHAKPSPQTVELGPLVFEVMKDLTGPIHESGARISLPDVMPKLKGDRGQILRLLTILFDNAIRHREAGRVPEIRLAVERQASRWLISLSDNGQGLDLSQSERLFRLFQTGAETRGAGIGLALARRIVERHGGRIWVEAAPGQGAAFRFTLADADS